MHLLKVTIGLLALICLAGFAPRFGVCTHRRLADPRDDAPPADKVDLDQPIVSLAIQGQYVFASTEAGLFLAGKDKKDWQPLQGKGTPEPSGYFVTRGPEDKTLFYFVTPASLQRTVGELRPWENADDKNKKTQLQSPGLYRSEDAGDTWERRDDADHFREMLRLPGGRMFAVAAAKKEEDNLILLSEDEGQTWKDVTNGISKDESWLILKRDPEHPLRICLYAPFTMRSGGTIYHAEDDQFRWKIRYAGLDAEEWPPAAQKSVREFLQRSYAPGYRVRWPAGTVKSLPDEVTGSFGKDNSGISSVGTLPARLDNYFAYPFDGEVSLPDYNVVPEKTSYEFGLKEPMPVQASLVSYTKVPLPRLLDSPDATLFWALKVIGPNDQKQAKPLRRDPLGHIEDENKTLEQSLKDHKLDPFQLTMTHPHNQTIDLRDLGAFDKPGRYKVQLIYHSGWWRDSQKVMRSLDPVAGQAFSVTITP